VINKININ